MLLVNLTAAIFLLAIYIGAYIKPSDWWPIPLISLAYPALLAINFAFILYWAFSKHKKRLLISTIIIVVGFHELMGVYQFKDFIGKENTDFKVMSYNCLNLGYYNWNGNKVIRNNIFDVLNQEQPDILCMQEFIDNAYDDFITADSIIHFLPTKYKHGRCNFKGYNGSCYGLMTFTRYKIINKGEIIFENSGNACIYTDVLYKKDTIRIYNCHLQSYKLMNENINALANLKNNKHSVKNFKELKVVFEKLKLATLKREEQAYLVAEHIKKSPYPTILCGDFNDVPTSYAYHTIRSSIGLNDAFVESGEGFGGTYVGRLPSFRIDYILYSDQFSSSRFRIRKEKLSDHFPIITEMKMD